MTNEQADRSIKFVEDNYNLMHKYFDCFFNKSKADAQFSEFSNNEDILKGWLMASFVTGLDFALNHHPDLVGKI